MARAGSNGHIQLQGTLGKIVYLYSQEEDLASFCCDDQEVRKCTVGSGVGNEKTISSLVLLKFKAERSGDELREVNRNQATILGTIFWSPYSVPGN